MPKVPGEKYCRSFEKNDQDELYRLLNVLFNFNFTVAASPHERIQSNNSALFL